MNIVILRGRLGKDVEVRHTNSGKAVAHGRLAVDDGYGENKQTQWITLIFWEKLAATAEQYCAKGKHLLVEGRLKTREFEKDGQKRSAVEVVVEKLEFLDRKEEAPAADDDGDSIPF